MFDNRKPTSSCCCSGASDNVDAIPIDPAARNLLEPDFEDRTTCPRFDRDPDKYASTA